ncbi:MAG TPA: NAD(P)/FAD-dependent oxidoreductase [Candidatus Ornithomonoglobus intestinigallinarum]|uniref:NAD(P)/FAD-dependent oxidoreductase n=1 Tax=Candidatus Ornithomonoglobus intestinigallinarum TaxID=2840894 RepID=A0A9D1H3S1_9FIRM|nr:NAD(P)/FAD-dependent oxidoreductase [Candidatus Ornithomonoglobus intestinigallinarum]
MKRTAVIGGGASGLLAAISSKEHGADVVIFEANERVGKKILSTGNGRCNLTNTHASETHYHGRDVSFIRGAASMMWVDETLKFFERIGVLARVEENGKVYPYCGTASSVLDALRERVKYLEIPVVTGFEVKDIIKKKDGFMLVSYGGGREKAAQVIIATGGKAAPSSGSKGGGYALLRKFGHTVTELSPSLVQIKTEPESVKGLKGIKVIARASVGNVSETGEILFTDYGLSGPPVFYLSSYIGTSSHISLDLMPEYTVGDVFKILSEKAENCPATTLESFTSGIISKKVGQQLIKATGISPLSRTAGSLTAEEIQKIASLIKNRRFAITGTMSWNNAQVTRGGALTSEFDALTLESKLAGGIYACGEVLDIDGDCGGYNLQWAWSSGYAAGKAAAERLLKI